MGKKKLWTPVHGTKEKYPPMGKEANGRILRILAKPWQTVCAACPCCSCRLPWLHSCALWPLMFAGIILWSHQWHTGHQVQQHFYRHFMLPSCLSRPLWMLSPSFYCRLILSDFLLGPSVSTHFWWLSASRHKALPPAPGAQSEWAIEVIIL